MPSFSLDIDPAAVKKIEDFFANESYKEYVENAISFNRKLNEERKMRIPYIDGQTGVAMKHYNSQRSRRERMPGRKDGQVYSYPQRPYRKTSYQYLKYFLQPKRFIVDPDAEMHTISQVENPSAAGEESNQSKEGKGEEWSYYDDEDIFGEEGGEVNSDSDFEYEDWATKRKKGKNAKSKSKSGSKSSFGRDFGKRRSDMIPDSEKPFSCELCGARYKTRPGLSYHASHTHKGEKVHIPSGGANGPAGQNHAANPPEFESYELSSDESSSRGPFATEQTDPGNRSSRRSAAGVSYREPDMSFVADPVEPPPMAIVPGGGRTMQLGKTMSGRDRAPSLGYCDFCLGDAAENKKTSRPEELVSCAECGRSGHPTCLQFTENMIISVRKYPWQCIECKTCVLCGTSENDDQLLFCDDCDRGYHMYCLNPPIKEPPEGSWSCNLCIETFHRK